MSSSPAGRPAPLCVLAWDHPRATRPLTACSTAWARHGHVPFTVSTRSLASFGDDVPTGSGADLVLIDHPHIGVAASTGAILPLDDLVAPEILAAIGSDAVGASQASYRHLGRTWALAIDAACQSLATSDVGMRGRPIPTTWSDVVRLAEATPGRVALPLHPAHAISALLSLLTAAGQTVGATSLGPPDTLTWACETLARIAAAGPAAAYEWEPPAALRLLERGELSCLPLVYSYVGYDVRWSDAPALTPGGMPGSILGGVGVAVLAGTPDPQAASDLAAWLTSAHTQMNLVASSSGQPANGAAWASADADRLFHDTRRTIEAALPRPRGAWWPAFQREGGALLRDGLRDGDRSDVIAARIESTYQTHWRSDL